MKRDSARIAIIAVFLVATVLVFIPIFIMLVDSFKTGSEIARNSWGWPQEPTLENYVGLLTYNSNLILKTYWNSIFVSTTYTVLVLFFSSMAAFAFAKFQFRGKNMIFALILTTMMVPAEITMPAIYLMFAKMKLLNTYSLQIFPGIANVFCMYMLRKYMETIPDSLLESARLDGAGTMRIFWEIMLPLSKPAIGAMAILTFLGKWNDYLWPRTLLTKESIMPIMVILPTLTTNQNVFIVPWETILAGCTIITLPVIVVFLIFQDQFMAGVSMGAVKE